MGFLRRPPPPSREPQPQFDLSPKCSKAAPSWVRRPTRAVRSPECWVRVRVRLAWNLGGLSGVNEVVLECSRPQEALRAGSHNRARGCDCECVCDQAVIWWPPSLESGARGPLGLAMWRWWKFGEGNGEGSSYQLPPEQPLPLGFPELSCLEIGSAWGRNRGGQTRRAGDTQSRGQRQRLSRHRQRTPQRQPEPLPPGQTDTGLLVPRACL